MTAQEIFANCHFLISHGHRTQWYLLQLMLQTRGLGFFPQLLLLSCPLRFHQGCKSPALMFLATTAPPPPHTQTHTPQLSVHTWNSEWREKIIGVLSFFFFFFTAAPLSAKKNDKIIFFLALSFKFWASFPQGKRNTPLCFGVLNREVSRPWVKALWLRSLVGNQYILRRIIQDGRERAAFKDRICSPALSVASLRWRSLCVLVCVWGSGGRFPSSRGSVSYHPSRHSDEGLPESQWVLHTTHSCFESLGGGHHR